jgi:hypothetical protein
MPIFRRRNPGRRFLAAVAATILHLWAVAALLGQHVPDAARSFDQREAIMVMDLDREEAAPSPTITLQLPVPRPDAAAALVPPDIVSSPPILAPSHDDWLMAGDRAAATAAAVGEHTGRTFGSVTRPADRPRTAKPFAWDKAHTQRVEPLPGGIRIRVSERCEMVLAPFPVGGCSLGKIPARGDLFAGMKKPADLGDWRDDSATLNGR